MPIHDWTITDASTFHNFHVLWLSTMTNRLNAGFLPTGYFAMTEQRVAGLVPDVLALRLADADFGGSARDGGVAVLPTKPKTSFVSEVPLDTYVRKANRITVRENRGKVVAVIEVVSPGNKNTKNAIHSFIKKSTDLLEAGINLLIVDPFPPGKRDPQGIHSAIWQELGEEPFELPAEKRLTMVAYQANPKTAFIEPIAVGDPLPDMPLFLDEDFYVNVPLEETYQTTWSALPEVLRRLVQR